MSKKKLKVREKKSSAKRKWKETVSYDCVRRIYMLYAVIRERARINLAFPDFIALHRPSQIFHETRTAKHFQANMFKIHDDASWERAYFNSFYYYYL